MVVSQNNVIKIDSWYCDLFKIVLFLLNDRGESSAGHLKQGNPSTHLEIGNDSTFLEFHNCAVYIAWQHASRH